MPPSPIIPLPGTWSEFTGKHPEGGIFQSPEMYDFWSRTEGHEPLVVFTADGPGRITGQLAGVVIREGSGLKGRLSARAVVTGGPLAEGDDPVIAGELLDAWDRLASRKALYTQFRNQRDMRALHAVFAARGYTCEPHLNYLTDLSPDEETLWQRVQPRRRNEIRKALKEGVTVAEAAPGDNIHGPLRELYERIRLPLPGPGFFETAREQLGPAGLYRAFGAYLGGKLIGTMIVLCYGNRVTNWYAGSYREHYGSNPNDLLPWEVMRWAKRNGYRVFDFGGAGHPAKPYGVRDYKAKFGGEEVCYGRYEKIHHPVLYRIARAGFRAWQLMS